MNFLAFESNVTNGVRVVAADVIGDGVADIIVGRADIMTGTLRTAHWFRKKKQPLGLPAYRSTLSMSLNRKSRRQSAFLSSSALRHSGRLSASD